MSHARLIWKEVMRAGVIEVITSLEVHDVRQLITERRLPPEDIAALYRAGFTPDDVAQLQRRVRAEAARPEFDGLRTLAQDMDGALEVAEAREGEIMEELSTEPGERIRRQWRPRLPDSFASLSLFFRRPKPRTLKKIGSIVKIGGGIVSVVVNSLLVAGGLLPTATSIGNGISTAGSGIRQLGQEDEQSKT